MTRYLGGAFDVESLVENLLGQLDGNQAILVNVYDVTNSSDPLIMYGNHCLDGDMSLLHESNLDFGDPFRKHQMICRSVCTLLLMIIRCIQWYYCWVSHVSKSRYKADTILPFVPSNFEQIP